MKTRYKLVLWGLAGILLAPLRFLVWLGRNTRNWHYYNDVYFGHRIGDVERGWELVAVETVSEPVTESEIQDTMTMTWWRRP